MSVSQADIDALFGTDEPSEPPSPPPSAAQTVTPSVSSAGQSTDSGNVDISRVLCLSVPVRVILAQRRMSVESLLDINVGTIIESDVPFDVELILHVANCQVGTGHAVKVGENFGLRVKRIGSVQERIDAMGPED